MFLIPCVNYYTSASTSSIYMAYSAFFCGTQISLWDCSSLLSHSHVHDLVVEGARCMYRNFPNS